MKNNASQQLEKSKFFYCIGLNYQKADAKIRGKFSLSETKQTALLLDAKSNKITTLSVLSTCNRTELYGIAENPFVLIKLLCKYTEGSLEEFDNTGYVYKEQEAINHIFRVGIGLDSQILGDFEIISQLRNSFRKSKEEGLLNAYMERLINAVIQAGKRVKNETELSSGATSTSYAAVHYIRQHIPMVSEKKILLFGTGKIGRNTIENLVKHTQNQHIGLINRTQVKAEEVSKKYNLQVKDYTRLSQEISIADILIVATGAQHPTITKSTILKRNKPLWIIDLSIPQNVDEKVDHLKHVHRIHLDELSQITQETTALRQQEVPKAERIIAAIQGEFEEWVHVRRFAPTIRALKDKLNYIKESEIDYQQKKLANFNQEQAQILGDRIIQKIITQFAGHLRTDKGEQGDSLELINQVFQLQLNPLEIE